jgi:putative transposase
MEDALRILRPFPYLGAHPTWAHRAHQRLFNRYEPFRNASQISSQLWLLCSFAKRFWENAIRDDEDLSQHVDYAHYNPVKHGLVTNPPELSYSSFRRYVDQGYYEYDWSEELELTVEVGSE